MALFLTKRQLCSIHVDAAHKDYFYDDFAISNSFALRCFTVVVRLYWRQGDTYNRIYQTDNCYFSIGLDAPFY